jgi:hypothetical protein
MAASFQKPPACSRGESSPKGLPVPPLEQASGTSYAVYIGIKQWGKVAEAIRDPEDVLILEGWQMLDQQSGTIAVYVMSATTKKQQQALREPQQQAKV